MRFAWIGWLCFCALAAMGLARAAALSEIPTASGLLVDEAGVLADEERGALLSRLEAIQRAERAQVVIVISKETGGEPLADYALRIAEAWQIGRRQRDDGLLIVVVPSPAGARIEVGYGLEGVIPDARASRWIDDLLPAVRNKEIAKGLDRLLDQIDGVLPAGREAASASGELFPGHPEWNAPFVLVVFSLFAIFPMFMGRWGSIPSAFLLAAFLGGAAWMLWGSSATTYAVAGTAFVLPLLWMLNQVDSLDLPPWLGYAKAFGNLIAVAMFFSIISLFAGAGLYAVEEPIWPAFVFSGMLSTGLAVFLFPALSSYLMVALRSAMHFVFILVVAYVALLPFMPDPTRIAFAAAATVTGCVALGLYLDSNGHRSARAGGIRWSLWLYGIAVLVALPFALLALILAVGGEDLQTQLAKKKIGSGWRDQLQLREVGRVARGIPREQGEVQNSCVRANKEIRQHASLGAALPSILQRDLSGEEQSLTWNRLYA